MTRNNCVKINLIKTNMDKELSPNYVNTSRYNYTNSSMTKMHFIDVKTTSPWHIVPPLGISLGVPPCVYHPLLW